MVLLGSAEDWPDLDSEAISTAIVAQAVSEMNL